MVRAGAPIYDRATDVAIMDRIFSGEAGSNGLVVAAVEVIEGQYLVLHVQGPAIFHVREERSARGAEYELLGVLDATFGGKGVENNSWTDVKELFR